MPTLKLADAEIYYEEFGSGFPVLAFAPGGHRSQVDFWHRSPANPPPWMDPTAELVGHFRVIAMDQRNAGKSHGTVAATDDWRTFANDHLALMDHLGIERCHTIGGCGDLLPDVMRARAQPDRDFVAGCAIPMLVLPGTDLAHPLAIGYELARLAPRGELVKRWRGPDHKVYSAQCVRDFLLRNTP